MTVLDREPGMGGLQVLDDDGNWIDAPYVEGSLIVNTGDMVDDETEGAFRLGFEGRNTDLIEFGGINEAATTSTNIQEALEAILDPGVSATVTAVKPVRPPSSTPVADST